MAEFAEAFQPLFEPARYKVYHGGRGSGKSWAFARALLILGAKKKLRILCTRELQSSIQESVHKLLSDQVDELNLRSRYQVLQTEIRGANGTEIIFEGIRSNVDKIKSMEAIDICWVEEADKVREASWAVLIPTIRKEGSEIWISFNPYLRTDSTWQRFVETQPPSAVVRRVSWRDNPWFPDELRAELDHLKAVDYDEYLHVWEGEFKSFASGAVYGKQLREARDAGRIRPNLPVEKSTEVHTTWDLGKGDATSVWFFQRVGPEVRFIDFLENRGEDIDYYAREVKARGYNLGKHYMPHDVEHDLLGMGSKNRRALFEMAGIKPVVVVPRIRHLAEGVEMVRAQFAHYWFDSEKCSRGIECLQNYRYEYSDKAIDFRPQPLHDWSSHACDALRQQAQADGGRSAWGVIEKPNTHREKVLNKWSQRSTGWMV